MVNVTSLLVKTGSGLGFSFWSQSLAAFILSLFCSIHDAIAPSFVPAPALNPDFLFWNAKPGLRLLQDLQLFYQLNILHNDIIVYIVYKLYFNVA